MIHPPETLTAAPAIQALADCRDKALVGGKAINLGKLIRAGFTVPGGFVVTTEAYRQAGNGTSIPDDLAADIARAYREIGSPPVAVRSSATAEDMAEASMAGQYDTFLDIRGEAALLQSVRRCWASLHSPRIRAYLIEHGIDIARVAMAVVVQALVPSDVAGVLFTANPRTGSRREMLVEASWGLGEAVVSGLVQPDVLRLDGETGRVLAATVADKHVWIPAGSNATGAGHEELPVEESRRRVPCLKAADVELLWKLGARAAAHFGSPQDLEWGISGGQLFLLQSRPITTLADAEAYESLLSATRAQLRAKIGEASGPWVLHNLAETLPHATPLTWSVIRRFMSGDGGFGAMYKQVGFAPSERVCREGFLDRVAGKLYMDTALAPEMFFEGYPYRYDLELLRSNPDAGQQPPTVPGGTMGQRMSVGGKVGRVGASVHALADTLDATLRDATIPAFVEYVAAEKVRDLAALDGTELHALWRERQQKVLDEFAPQSLLPSLVCGMALGELKTFLSENFWDEDSEMLAHSLSAGHAPDCTVRANCELYEVATGKRPVDRWLAEYGHRAPEEMELATPRWRERPADLLTLAARLKGGADPAELHAEHARKTEQRLDGLREKLSPKAAAELDRRVALVRRYMPFREDGKYYLMLGYDLLRDVALEVGRRLDIGADAFLLSEEELFDAFHVGYAPSTLIAQRRVERRAEERIALPAVIDADAIDTLGESPKVDSAGSHSAFAVSSGLASGPARIVRSPEEAGDLGQGYVLVCPSTDPAWTPLFVNAAGLILECGGSLSHGAVVAREMSIPAVVLGGATTLLKEGEFVTVDGRRGAVVRAEVPKPTNGDGNGEAHEAAFAAGSAERAELLKPLEVEHAPDAADTRVSPSQLPPPAGEFERWSGKITKWFALAWGVYLLGAWLLPDAWLYRPTMNLLDALLWPVVRRWGKPAVVIGVAGALAAATMILQKLLTDNNRLREAKRRADALTREAAKLPKDSPRAQALRALAGGVPARTFAASMVPLAVLLGPMCMTFFWFPGRVDPSSWSPPPGTPVSVTGAFNSALRESVTIEPTEPLKLSLVDSPSQTLPPIRRVLEELKARWSQGSDLSAEPLEVRLVGEWARRELLAQLSDYLDRGVPPQSLTWNLTPTERVAGKFPVRVRPGASGSPVSIDVVEGDTYPPGPTEILGDPGSPLKSLKLTYPSHLPYVFASWLPLQRFHDRWWWPSEWLELYLIVYIPVMFALRFLLRLA